MPIRDQIILEGVNKTQNAFSQVQRSLSGVERNVGGLNRGFSNLQRTILGVAASIGAVKFAQGFLQTAREVENLGVQLKFLTGSAQEGAKAMDILTQFAGTVPFQLREIALATPSLLTVAESTDELNQLLKITGDIAAATGLDFQTTALQLQRTFSAGIASAELFRERGVKSFLGFKDGVQYSAEESRDIIIRAFTEGTTTIAGASQEMATTFNGALSMIGDKFFTFQKMVMDSGPFDVLKIALQEVNRVASNNFDDIQSVATSMGDSIVRAMSGAILGVAQLTDMVRPIFKFVLEGLGSLYEFIRQLPPVVRELGVIGFLALGIKGKLIAVTIGAVVDDVKMIWADLTDFFARAKDKVADFYEVLGFEDAARDMRTNANSLRAEAQSIRDKIEGIGDTAAYAGENIEDMAKINLEELGITVDAISESMGITEQAAVKVLMRLNELMRLRNDIVKEDDDLIGGGKKTDTDKSLQDNLKKQAEMLQKKFLQLEESLQDEETREQNSYRNKLKILDDYYAGRTHFDKKYMELKERLTQQHEKKIKEIQDRNAKEQRATELRSQGVLQKDIDEAERLRGATRFEQNQAILNNTVEMFRALGTENKKAFQAYKAFAVAQAVVDTYKSAQSAFTAMVGIPFVGPALAFTAAGAAIAAGMARVNAIRSQTYGGRRAGGPVTGGSPFLVGEAGPEIYTPKTNGEIIPLDKMKTGKKVDVNFNITTLDADSFQDLLVRERGLIVNIINDAVMEQGREAVV